MQAKTPSTSSVVVEGLADDERAAVRGDHHAVGELQPLRGDRHRAVGVDALQ
jgi:hypothetical protein